MCKRNISRVWARWIIISDRDRACWCRLKCYVCVNFSIIILVDLPETRCRIPGPLDEVHFDGMLVHGPGELLPQSHSLRRWYGVNQFPILIPWIKETLWCENTQWMLKNRVIFYYYCNFIISSNFDFLYIISRILLALCVLLQAQSRMMQWHLSVSVVYLKLL